MKKALLDASSAILLFKSGLFDDLLDSYNIIITESVYDELTANDHIGAKEFRNYRRSREMGVQPSLKREGLNQLPFPDTSSLGKGERDTIHQFYSGVGHFIIIDDGKGARYCRDNRIPYINALLFPRILYLIYSISETGFNNKAEKVISIGRYSQEIIDYALTCTKDDLEFFLH
jgi:hypothetical protein